MMPPVASVKRHSAIWQDGRAFCCTFPFIEQAARRMPGKTLNATGLPSICAGNLTDSHYGQFFGNNRKVSCA
jgi:hypothetical protein